MEGSFEEEPQEMNSKIIGFMKEHRELTVR